MTIEEFLVSEGVLREPSSDVADNLQQTRDYNRMLVNRIIRAAERYKNQETRDLQAKILAYRNGYVSDYQVDWYDKFFGITVENGVPEILK